jgi:hypothetical protein
LEVSGALWRDSVVLGAALLVERLAPVLPDPLLGGNAR